MGLSKKQIDNIMNIVEQAGSKKATLPTLPSVAQINPLQGLVQQKQNAVTRLNSVGVDTGNIEDTRNPLEQVLNLPEEQNMFFDLMEIINRPQQALFGGIANLQKGKDFGSGFVEGLTGEKDTAGGDLIRNAIGEKEDGSIDWTDFAGFALDVFLDPADLALGLVTGGASIGVTAGANALDTGSDAVKLVKEGVEGAQALNNVKKTNILGIAQDMVFGKGNRIYVPKNAEEYIKLLTDKALRAEKGIQKISVTDSIFRTAGSGIKVGGAFADSLVETTLSKMDSGLLDTYKAFKNQFSETMKNTAGAVRKAVSASEQRLVSTYEKFTDMFKDYDDTTRILAQQANMSVPQFQRAIMTVYEHNFMPNQTLGVFEMLDYVINSPVGMVRYADDTQEALVEMFGKEWIDEFTTKMTQNVNGQDMEFLVFDKDFWNLQNKEVADMFFDSKHSGISLLNKADRARYEDALRIKDPAKYEEYMKIKEAETADNLLEQEVEVEFNNLYPRESSKRLTDPKKIEQAKTKIRNRLRKTKLVNKSGAEYFLKNNVDPADIEKLVSDDILAKEQYKNLNTYDKYEYNRLRTIDEMNIDRKVAQSFPKKEFDDFVEEAEYIKKRRTYAMELRKEKASYKASQDYLDNAMANPSTQDLFNLQSPDDLDDMKLDTRFLPKEMRKDFNGLKKIQKEMEDIRAKVADEELLTKSKVYQNRVKKYADMKQALFNKYSGLSMSEASKIGTEPVEQVVKETAKAQPKVPIHRFYTDEQLQAIEQLSKNDFVQQGVNKFKDTITEVQKQIGIAEFGKENALIDLSMQGYATHTKTAEAQQAWDAVTKYANQNNVKGFFAPGNTRVLGTRGYQMSAVEANNVKKAYNKYLWENDEWFQQNVPDEMQDIVKDFFDKDQFSEQADESIMGLMDDKYKAINKNKRTTDMLVAMSIGNPNGDTSAVRFINASAPEPKGFVRLRPDETRKLRKVISETKKYAGEGLYINKLLSTIESGLSDSSQLIMEKHLYNMLNVFEKDPTDALQVLDKFTSLYKMLKTSNPISFNGKNFTGNAFNMWASGMSFPEVIRNWNKATDYINKFDKAKLVDEALRTPEQKAVVEAMEDMLQNGYFKLDSVYDLNDMGNFKAINSMKEVNKKGILNNKLTEANMYMNLWVDNHARMALYLHAKENPEYLAKLGFDATDPKSAMNAVRMVLFDPKDLSLWEEDYMKRLIPFYTFTRQNLAFQMKNITKNSTKYYRAYKALNSVYNAFDINPDEVNQWERDDFYLPVFSKKNGEYIAIKTSIPFADMINLFQDPVKKVVSSTNPLIKGLYEGVSGTNTFTGRPIENYQGEMSSNIPFVSKKTEWEMSQTGIDVPLKTASGIAGVVGDLISGEDPTKNLGRATGLTYQGDVEKAKQAREYQKINALLDKIKAVKASGKEVPTLDEIASNTNSAKTNDRLAQMQSIVDMINNIKR